MAAMKETMKKALLPLGVLFVYTNVPLEAETKTVIARFLFTIKTVIIIISMGIIKFKMSGYVYKGAADKIKVEETSYVDGEITLQTETLTPAEYDERELSKTITQNSLQTGVVVALHWYLLTEIPLVVTSVISIVQLYESPLFRIFVRGRTSADDEDLRRPFKMSLDTTGFYKRFMGVKSDRDKKAPSTRSQKKELKAKERQEKKKIG